MLPDPPGRGIYIKDRYELEAMIAVGKLASECLEWILGQVVPGMTTLEIDALQRDFAKRHGAVPAPLNYKGFPKTICTSPNEVVCHGIPSKKVRLKEGDIVGVDVTLIIDGFHGDNAATIPVGQVSDEAARLLFATLEANRLGIAAAGAAGARIGDVGAAIQAAVEPLGYSVVRDFVGHGVGREFHEAPQVPHYGTAGRGVRFRPGMTFTVEPMINAGDYDVEVLDDGWTAVTVDGSLSAQFEHSVAITEEGLRVLTVQNDEGAWEPPGRCRLPEVAGTAAATP